MLLALMMNENRTTTQYLKFFGHTFFSKKSKGLKGNKNGDVY